MGAIDDPNKSRRYVSHRSSHRARSHDSAHAESLAPTAKVIDHPLVPAGPATVIDADADLLALIEHLRGAGRFAYDSEFIGELTYVPKLCLIQAATADRIALVDPLAELDLRPFWELIADPAVEKVVHAGQQDLEPIVRELGVAPANVFDTQIAAGFIGLPYPLSLSKLVHETAGVKIGKGLTFTHWDQRPLSTMQLRYAADDVRYLVLARQEIGSRLEALGHTRWAAEECAAQCDPKLYQFDPEFQYLRVRGAGGLQPRNLAVLRQLTVWRDSAAREANVPPRAFLKDEVMIDLSRNPIRSVDKLARVRGLPRPIESEYGQEIVDLTARAMNLPEDELPVAKDTEQTPLEKFRTDSLWAVTQSLCAGRSIDVSVVTTRHDINDFYHQINSPDAGLPPHRLLTGWRREAAGSTLLDLVGGKGRIELTWPDGALRAAAGREAASH